jgi:DNA-binding helix-hairpin-helix protein with protein kinase domain
MSILLKTSSGRTIRVEDIPFAKGGEGGVHKIIYPSNTSECCKIYFPKQRTAERKNKIEFMVRNAPANLLSHNHVICWAKEAVYQGNNFVGFTMPLAFDGSVQLYELCVPKLSQKLSNTWRQKYNRDNSIGIQSRLKLCTNLSSAIHSIHQLNNYVLVDLKPQNVLVTVDGKVSLIDCDSIQISSNSRILFPSRVATPEYVPPEGIRINPAKNIVPHSWDRFSMAIMFYEIIFGLHPYAATFKGRFQNSTSLESKIKEGLYVHGKNKHYISALPPLHNNFAIIPNSLKILFNRAFDLGHQMPDARPSAREWGNTIFHELTTSKTTFNPTVKTKPSKNPNINPNLKKNNSNSVNQNFTPPPNHSFTPIPNKKEEGIGFWFIVYCFIPLIGFIMFNIYLAQGKNRKSEDAFISSIIGALIFLIINYLYL